MKNPLVIGLSGKKGSGKDHTCHLLRRLGWESSIDVERLAFADPLKDEVAQACGVTREFIEKNKPNFRLILQGWGSEFRRQLCGDSYWLKKLDDRINESSCDIVVISDARFRNEADFIRNDWGGLIVRIDRNENQSDPHPSEIDLDDYDFDYRINNDGSAAFDDYLAVFWDTVILPRFLAIKNLEQ